MLVLSRRPGEEIVIGDNIRITIVAVKGDRVRIGIDAPKNIAVNRSELLERLEVAVPVLVGAGEGEIDFGHPAAGSADDTLRH